jgi:hypothetical protein
MPADKMTPEQEDVMMSVASSMLGAGTETVSCPYLLFLSISYLSFIAYSMHPQTVGSIQSFILAMVLNPHVQAKAQAEIARVITPGHLPSYNDDLENLPYVTATALELLRFSSGLPSGVPHYLETESDDVYEGWRIPKGSIVIANIWYVYVLFRLSLVSS